MVRAGYIIRLNNCYTHNAICAITYGCDQISLSARTILDFFSLAYFTDNKKAIAEAKRAAQCKIDTMSVGGAVQFEHFACPSTKSNNPHVNPTRAIKSNTRINININTLDPETVPPTRIYIGRCSF